MLSTTLARSALKEAPGKRRSVLADAAHVVSVVVIPPGCRTNATLHASLKKVELPHGLGINLCVKKLAASRLLKYVFVTRPGRGGHGE